MDSHAPGQGVDPLEQAARAGARRCCTVSGAVPPCLGTDTSQGSQVAAVARRSRRAYTMCERMSTTQICTKISSCFLLHHCDMRRLVFEQAKSQFTIEAPRIQLGHLR